MTIAKGLRVLPLFQGISEARLEELVTAFSAVSHPAGTVLFRPGETATRFALLVKGEVALQEEPTSTDLPPAKFDLRPVAPIGELGALAGLPRSTTATATTDVELLSINVGDLLGFFDENGDIGLSFYKNLLGTLSDKIRRDRSRLEDMRTNLVRTQKAMKQMREMILSSPETSLSKPIFETLDRLIAGNRRANYRVTPTVSYPAHVRRDDGVIADVIELSEGYLKVRTPLSELTNDPTYWAGVLVLPAGEILVSGAVVREDKAGVVVKLDPPMDESKSKLDDYTMRVQLLDYVV